MYNTWLVTFGTGVWYRNIHGMLTFWGYPTLVRGGVKVKLRLTGNVYP